MNFNVVGMMGLGDNLHQRAVMRQLMERGIVWLQTPWPSVYWDLVGPKLHLMPLETRLRTQLKNAAREKDRYTARRAPAGSATIKPWYHHEQMRRGPILKAMMENTGTDYGRADFSLPIPDAWNVQVDNLTKRWPDRPILLYRPLVERGEWGGCRARNPDFKAYAALLEAAREGMCVVSIADLQPPREYLVGELVKADVTFHHGELTFEVLAALAARSAAVFTSPGFATILGQAVGTKTITVYGGHEDSRVCCVTPTTLCIDPINPCCCLTHTCGHNKTIDIPAAVAKIRRFL